MVRRAKIVATLGPASADEETLAGLLHAGSDGFRFNLSHGTRDEHRAVHARLRQVAEREGVSAATMIDLRGPRYRLGELPAEGRSLAAGEEVSIGADASEVDLPLGDPGLVAHLETGDRVLVDDGAIELEIRAVDRSRRRADAEVVTGGTARSEKGINLPDTELPFSVSDKDREDLALAIELGADYVAASYVGEKGDLDAVRRAMDDAGRRLPLIAKIERARAIEHLEDLVASADALMVARGDLGVELPFDQVPVLQERILDAGRAAGKPVLVATQMLESMIDHARPTRAEASDVAGAVFAGADGLLLSAETAIGNDPVRVVRTMDRIIREAEGYRPAARRTESVRPGGRLAASDRPLAPLALEHEEAAEGKALAIPDIVATAAVLAADRLPADRIVAFSQSGFTARLVARHRPEVPIVVVTPDECVARRLKLLWGAEPLVLSTDVRHLDEVVAVVDRSLLAAGLAQPDDLVVLVMGDPIPERPLTNTLRVHRVREGDGSDGR